MGQASSAPVQSVAKDKRNKEIALGARRKTRRRDARKHSPRPRSIHVPTLSITAEPDNKDRARADAEARLVGRSTGDNTPSPLSSDLIARSPVWGKQDSESSPELEGLGVRVAGAKLSGLQVKRTESGRPHLVPQTSSRQHLRADDSTMYTSAPKDAQVNDPTYEALAVFEQHRNGRTVDDMALLAVPQFPIVDPSSPRSHWSESSAGCPTPPPPMQSFRDSLNLALNTKRFSSHSAHRLSGFMGQLTSDPPGGSSSSDEQSKRSPPRSPTRSPTPISKAGQRKGKGSKKRAPIVIVSAERVGSGRYSMMKAAAEKSALARRSSAETVEIESAGVEEDLTTEDVANTRHAPATVISSRVPLVPLTSDTASAPEPARRSSAEELLTFIAASPDLTCPDPDAPPFETRVQPRLSLSRVPAGHPANHHMRFRNRIAAATGAPMMSDMAARRATEPTLAGSSDEVPAQVAMRALSLDHGRLARTDGATRDSVTSLGAARRQIPAEAPSLPEDRRGSSASWATTRSRGDSAAFGDGRRVSSTSSQPDRRSSARSSSIVNLPLATGPVAPPRARPISTASRLSFPHSVVSGTELDIAPRREHRLASTSSSILPVQDMPTTPEDLPSPPALPASSPGGRAEVDWSSYSIVNAVSPVASPGVSTTTDSSEIAPETVAAFPMPPTSLRQEFGASARQSNQAPCLPSAVDRIFGRPLSYPSDASTPESARSSLDTATSLTVSDAMDHPSRAFVEVSHVATDVCPSLAIDFVGDKDETPVVGRISPALSWGRRSSGTATGAEGHQAQAGVQRDSAVTRGPSPTYRFPASASSSVGGVDGSSSSRSGRRPSTARLESPAIQLWPCEPLPSAVASVATTSTRRDSRVLQLDQFRMRFETPILGTVPSATGMSSALSPTQDDLDIDADELEAAQHRFPVSDLPLSLPREDTDEVEENLNEPIVADYAFPPSVDATRRHHSTTELPDGPPLVPVSSDQASGPRRGTFPLIAADGDVSRATLHATPQPVVGLEILVRQKQTQQHQTPAFGGSTSLEDHRLGSVGKRGFDRGEVSQWLGNVSWVERA